MTIQPGAAVYTQGFGTRPENVEVPHIDVRPPVATDVLYPQGKRWTDSVGNSVYELTSFTTTNGIVSANWALLGTAGGALNTLTGDIGTATPSAGNIQIAGTSGEIVTSASGAVVTLALAGPFAAPTFTAHGVLIGEGSSPIVATTPGTNGQVLIGSTGADPAFATISSSGSTLTLTGGAHTLNIDVAAPLNVAHGGTGATTLTGVLTGNGTSAVTANAVTQHGVLLGGATNAVSSLAVAATGTVLAGASGADPAFTGSPSVSGTVTAGTGMTSTTGNITATAGNLVATVGTLNLNGAASKINLNVATGASASAGTATLGAGGTVTVATTAVTASSLIFCSYNNCTSTLAAALDAPTASISAGVHFVINSQDATDTTSTVNWWLIN